jgi:hypothetical protein
MSRCWHYPLGERAASALKTPCTAVRTWTNKSLVLSMSPEGDALLITMSGRQRTHHNRITSQRTHHNQLAAHTSQSHHSTHITINSHHSTHITIASHHTALTINSHSAHITIASLHSASQRIHHNKIASHHT